MNLGQLVEGAFDVLRMNDHVGWKYVTVTTKPIKIHPSRTFKEAVDQSIWRVKLFVPARGTSLESVLCRFFVLTIKRVCCISDGFIGMSSRNDPKWSKNHRTNHQCHQFDVQGFQSMSPRALGSPAWRPWSSGCVAQGAVCWAKGRPRFNTKMAENQAKRYQQTLWHLGWTYIWMQQIMWGFLLSNLNFSYHQWHNLILWYHPSPSHEGIKLCFKDLSFDETARFTLAATWWSSLLWWR